MMKLLWISIIVITCFGCYESIEKCLDPAATNYDVTADEPCPNCCTYPKITTTFIHQAAPESNPQSVSAFRYNTPYPSPYDTNHFFSISKNRYFISKLRLVKSDGTEVSVRDSLLIQSPAGTTRKVLDDFYLVDRDFLLPLSSKDFIAEGNFTKLRFRFGLEENLVRANPESTPVNHALSLRSDSTMYKNGTGYLSHVLKMNRDTLPSAPVLDLSSTQSREIELELPATFNLKPGFSVQLRITLNYLKWFEGINIKTETETSIREKVFGNLHKAFKVSEIKA
jgi:hypothetical protein